MDRIGILRDMEKILGAFLWGLTIFDGIYGITRDRDC